MGNTDSALREALGRKNDLGRRLSHGDRDKAGQRDRRCEDGRGKRRHCGSE